MWLAVPLLRYGERPVRSWSGHSLSTSLTLTASFLEQCCLRRLQPPLKSPSFLCQLQNPRLHTAAKWKSYDLHAFLLLTSAAWPTDPRLLPLRPVPATLPRSLNSSLDSPPVTLRHQAFSRCIKYPSGLFPQMESLLVTQVATPSSPPQREESQSPSLWLGLPFQVTHHPFNLFFSF